MSRGLHPPCQRTVIDPFTVAGGLCAVTSSPYRALWRSRHFPGLEPPHSSRVRRAVVGVEDCGRAAVAGDYRRRRDQPRREYVRRGTSTSCVSVAVLAARGCRGLRWRGRRCRGLRTSGRRPSSYRRHPSASSCDAPSRRLHCSGCALYALCCHVPRRPRTEVPTPGRR